MLIVSSIEELRRMVSVVGRCAVSAVVVTNAVQLSSLVHNTHYENLAVVCYEIYIINLSTCITMSNSCVNATHTIQTLSLQLIGSVGKTRQSLCYRRDACIPLLCTEIVVITTKVGTTSPSRIGIIATTKVRTCDERSGCIRSSCSSFLCHLLLDAFCSEKLPITTIIHLSCGLNNAVASIGNICIIQSEGVHAIGDKVESESLFGAIVDVKV